VPDALAAAQARGVSIFILANQQRAKTAALHDFAETMTR
jgi:hypothetical protein